MVEQPESGPKSWYAVRCVFEVSPGPPTTYEERVTLWRAAGFDEAMALAETEAAQYGGQLDAHYLGLAQCYALDDEPTHGAEVFSLMRDSDLDREAYVKQFFDTGAEHQQQN